MTITTTLPERSVGASTATSAAPAGTARHDIYAGIHRALRLLMGDTLGRLGRLDPEDAEEVQAVGGQVAQLLAACRSHLEHEDAFIHAAIETRAPGRTRRVSDDHVEHEQAIAALEVELATLRQAPGAAAVLRLHRHLALFIADNLRHMEYEETVHNQALWQTHTNDEIRGVEQALVASLPAQELMFVLEWMTRALPPAERAAHYGGLQARMPPQAFRQLLAMARRVLDARDWHKLAGALGVPT